MNIKKVAKIIRKIIGIVQEWDKYSVKTKADDQPKNAAQKL